MRRKQREAYEGHIKDNLRDLLLWEEQSWMTFVRSEDSAFNGTLKKVAADTCRRRALIDRQMS